MKRGLFPLLLAAGIVGLASAAHALDLRYRMKQGERYLYAFKIEADLEEYRETWSGTQSYTVKSVDGDTMHRSLLRIEGLGAHRECAAGNPAHPWHRRWDLRLVSDGL